MTFRTGDKVSFTSTDGTQYVGHYLGKKTPTRSSGSYFLVAVGQEIAQLFTTSKAGKSLTKTA